MAKKPKHHAGQQHRRRRQPAPPPSPSRSTRPIPRSSSSPHPSDNAAYQIIDTLAKEKKISPLPFPTACGGTEPILTLAQILGAAGPAVEASITAAGQMVFTPWATPAT